MRIFIIAAIIAAVMAVGSDAFVSSSSAFRRQSNFALDMTKLTYNGKSAEVREGTPLKNAVSKVGYKPRYSCKKGDCGSCTLSVGGTRIKACVGKVPPQPRLKSLQEKGLELR